MTSNTPSGFLVCIASGSVYLEFTAYFPSRSGSEVVFLEQAYPRPTWFFATTFAVQSVILSFSSSNAIGMYLEVSITPSTYYHEADKVHDNQSLQTTCSNALVLRVPTGK